jgi:hypothetical protein
MFWTCRTSAVRIATALLQLRMCASCHLQALVLCPMVLCVSANSLHACLCGTHTLFWASAWFCAVLLLHILVLLGPDMCHASVKNCSCSHSVYSSSLMLWH